MGPFEKQVEANFTEPAVVEASRHTVPSVGDRVMYAKSFLKIASTGPTDPVWFARGKLVSVKNLGGSGGRALGTVDWDSMPGESFPPKIITTNLVKVGTNEG